uniref:Galactose-3-O-sulfotransferase 1b n=1 Tax=Eptatretus burgeri TaxID=7764 RepID=A0A8C4NC49_EPTBU
MSSVTIRKWMRLSNSSCTQADSYRGSDTPISHEEKVAPFPCFPHHNIMFLKTHKAAGSTVLNILLRFGQKYSLRFALPRRTNDFSYPEFFKRDYVDGYAPGTHFNILANHLRFCRKELHEVMPADTIYITILRDPGLLFDSSFHYFAPLVPFTWNFGGGITVEEFLRDPWYYYRPSGLNAHLLKNLQAFDLGLDYNLNSTDPYVDELFHNIEKTFKLIMISEYFDESLVLLKDLLCWDFDDIVYFKLNMRAGGTSQLSNEAYSHAHAWNGLDLRLYKHFNNSLWHLIKSYGIERMRSDVKELHRRKGQLAYTCLERGGPVVAENVRNKGLQPWQPPGASSIMGYNLRTNLSAELYESCRKMVMPELQYLSELGVSLWLTKLWSWIRWLVRW